MLAAIKKELVLRKGELGDLAIETIYFGGGTPSILQAGEIMELVGTIYKHFKVSNTPEITLEANPDDLVSVRAQSRTVYEDYVEIGINRLSIGIQSFFDSDLKLMNRAHNAKEANSCIEVASQYVENISIDLIYGIPGMSDDRWVQNIEKALAQNVPHISAYALTVEPRTALAHFIEQGKVSNVDDEQAERQFQILVEVLNEEGFVNYETSNFGKPDFFSKNNTAYWQGKPYLGIGPSAHSFDGTQRGWNVGNNSKYIQTLNGGKLPIEREVLSKRDRYNEYVMTGLRTIWGISLEKIRSDFGPKYEAYLIKQAKKYVDEHFLFWDDEVLLTTKKGKFLADGIASDLFMLNLK